MSRMLVLAAALFLTVAPTSRAAEDAAKSVDARRIAALEDELRLLLRDFGPTHPAVLILKQRIALLNEAAQAEKINQKGLLVVFAKERLSTTLKDAKIRSLGGRSFVVGVEVEGPKITKPNFPGNMVWIPLDDVVQMIELDDDKGK